MNRDEKAPESPAPLSYLRKIAAPHRGAEASAFLGSLSCLIALMAIPDTPLRTLYQSTPLAWTFFLGPLLAICSIGVFPFRRLISSTFFITVADGLALATTIASGGIWLAVIVLFFMS